jgi:hypothetical protein
MEGCGEAPLPFAIQPFSKQIGIDGSLCFHRSAEAQMAEYRLFFLGSDGAIEARQDFIAPDDRAAQQIMTVLAEATSDAHHGVMLWQGSRRIFEKHDGVKPECGISQRVTAATLAAENQQRVIDCEEALLNSHWRLAKSKMLLDAMDKLRRDAGREATAAS